MEQECPKKKRNLNRKAEGAKNHMHELDLNPNSELHILAKILANSIDTGSLEEINF